MRRTYTTLAGLVYRNNCNLKRLQNFSLSYNKHKKFSWDKTEVNLEVCWVILVFIVWAKNLILSLDLKTKRTEESAI